MHAMSNRQLDWFGSMVTFVIQALLLHMAGWQQSDTMSTHMTAMSTHPNQCLHTPSRTCQLTHPECLHTPSMMSTHPSTRLHTPNIMSTHPTECLHTPNEMSTPPAQCLHPAKQQPEASACLGHRYRCDQLVSCSLHLHQQHQ